MTSIAKLMQPERLRDRLAVAHAGPTPVPSLDTTRIQDKTVKKRAERLLRARDAVLAGTSMKECAEIAGLERRWFERLLERYLSNYGEGESSIFGERAFLRDLRLKRHPVRTKPADPSRAKTRNGCSGLFLKLLREKAALRAALVETLRRKGKRVLEVNKLVGRELRKMFERLCEDHGVKEDEYPRNTDDKGLRPLRRWIVTDFLPGHALDWIAAEHGLEAAKAVTVPVLKPTVVTDYGLYIDWVLDEVRIDCRTSVQIINAAGDPDVVQRDQFHMIRVVELGFNTNLATWPVWTGKASAYDVGNLLWRALNGWSMSSEVLPELVIDPGGGFPVMVLPELRWKAPRRIYLDNALSHLSVVIGVIVSHVLGAELRLGRPESPKERPEIEAKFALQARRLVHQMVGTTGTGPMDPQRKRFDDLEPHQLLVGEALEKGITVMAANENGSPTTAAHGIPPLERLRRAVLRGGIDAQTVPLNHQVRHMFFPAKRVKIHVDLAAGRKPYCNFMRVRYSSVELQKRYDLNGKDVLARFDPDDLRVLILFTEDGAEITRVHGEGRWGILPNDIRMRQMAMRNIDRAQRERMPQDGPLEHLFASLRDAAPKSPSAAARLAHCLAVIGRHLQQGATSTPEWFASLLAEGNTLEAAALCRPAANSPSMHDGAAEAAQKQAAAPAPSRFQPRNAVRRLA